MKKIFTLIFSLGLLTTAFAQGGHRHPDSNSNNSWGNQSSYQHDQQKNGNNQGYQAAPYSNSDNWNYQSNNRRDDNRYGNKVNNRDGFEGRDDMRGSFDNSRFNDGRFYKGMNNRHSETCRIKPGLQIFFGFSSHHK
ncbi:MAG: hypothetical protein ACHQF0_15740 [Chitinophagales bacterium]